MRASSSTRTAHEDAVLQDLANVVHGVVAPFACGGTLVPDEPVALRFKDGSEVSVKSAKTPFEQPGALRALVDRCAPAPFGHGKKTRYDRSVRNALQLKAERGAFSVHHFDPVSSGVLGEVRRLLAPDDPAHVTAELYSLNVYGSDGHFLPHKDTPRGSDMIGTLVVCLPSQFSQGDLVLTHRGIHRVFDWAEQIRTQAEPSRLHWAAFFGDVDHEIQKVWTGLRVTLSYILRRGEHAVHAPEPSRPEAELLHERLIAALADRRFLPRGGALGFPCFHLYGHEPWSRRRVGPLSHVTTSSVSKLKGRDQHVARAALAAGLKVYLQPYLVESCADETWQLERFPDSGAGRGLGDQVEPSILEDVLEIRAARDDVDGFGVTWVESPPLFNFSARRPRPQKAKDDPDTTASDEPAIEQFHACEYSATGYFGNEGGDTEFYVYAALQVEWPRWEERERPKEAMKRGARRDAKLA